MNPLHPRPGELWSTDGEPRHAIYLGDGLWNILVHRHDEYALHQTGRIIPSRRGEHQPSGHGWEPHFNALALAHGIDITWEQEVARYKAIGLALVGIR